MIKIQLDIQALEKLFPEGSEAYFNFQTAVIAEATKRFTKGISEARLKSIVTEQVRLTEDEIKKNLGLSTIRSSYPWSSNISLTEESKRQIKGIVQDQVNQTVKDELNLLTPKLHDIANEAISRNLSIIIHSELKRVIAVEMAGVSDTIKGHVRTEMEKLLGPKQG